MSASEQLQRIVKESRRMVFFGGAGVSTESGIPDFRSAEGLYSGTQVVPAETIISAPFLRRHPADFFSFYREHLLFPDAKPNRAHKTLAKWETEGKLSAVITQNIDGLHQAAGSQVVWELHGSVHRNYCERCKAPYPLSRVLQTDEAVPTCDCGGMIRPDVTLYGEQLNPSMVEGALAAIADSDTLIIGGTSLRVYPAAAYVQNYPGRLVIINKSPTDMDRDAELCIAGSIGEALGQAAGIP